MLVTLALQALTTSQGALKGLKQDHFVRVQVATRKTLLAPAVLLQQHSEPMRDRKNGAVWFRLWLAWQLWFPARQWAATCIAHQIGTLVATVTV